MQNNYAKYSTCETSALKPGHYKHVSMLILALNLRAQLCIIGLEPQGWHDWLFSKLLPTVVCVTTVSSKISKKCISFKLTVEDFNCT